MVVAQQEIEQAKALARQGNSQAAIALLSKLIRREASNVEAWLALADVVEEPDRVGFCLQKVLNLDPGNATALEKLSKMKGGSLSFEPARQAAARPRRQAVAAASRSPAPSVQDLLDQGGKLLSSFGRTDLILIGLTVFAGLVLCSLAGAAVIGKPLFSSQPAESPDEVVQVVFDNVIAANREDLGAYMATIHPESPGYNATQTTIRSAFSLYDLSYEIFIPEMIEQDKSEALISFVLTTRKVRGAAFQNNRVTGEMTLRKYEGEWMIYDQRVDDIQYLN